MSKKPEKLSKAVVNGRKTAAALPGKLKIPSRRRLIIGGVAALVILVLLIFLTSSAKKKPPAPLPQAATALLSPEFAADPVATVVPEASQADRRDLPTIQAIRFQPPQPTRMDTLRAEVVTEASDPDRITYAYLWKVNDRPVEDATGDTLNLSAFKKWDFVSLTVTPYDGDREGPPAQSPVVAIHSIPPSLELKAQRQTKKAGEPMQFELVSVHPDSDGIAFSLEAPIVPGMSIDASSGKITWKRQSNQKGTTRFGAAVEDTEKTKVTKIFNITIE